MDSCIQQSYQPIEIVIVDDGSTDSSAEIIQEHARRSPGIVRFYSQPNQGAPVARNTGATLAKGELLLFLDADDYLYRDGVSHLVNRLGDDADIAYGDVRIVDSEGRAIHIREQAPHSDDWVVAMFEKSPITTSVLFRRKVIEACRWDIGLACSQEFALHVNCAIQGFTFRHTASVVAAIRQHDSPTRISNRAASLRGETGIKLTMQFRQQLLERGCLSSRRRASLDYFLLQSAVSLWRTGQRGRAMDILALTDPRLLRQAHAFKYVSYEGIATIAGIRASHVAWQYRQRLRRIVGKLLP
jgi:hypothetical protein